MTGAGIWPSPSGVSLLFKSHILHLITENPLHPGPNGKAHQTVLSVKVKVLIHIIHISLLVNKVGSLFAFLSLMLNYKCVLLSVSLETRLSDFTESLA